MSITFDEEMRAALAAGQPNLDNVTDPNVIGAYGLEPDTDDCQGDGCRTQIPYGEDLCANCQAAADEEAVTCSRCELVVDAPHQLCGGLCRDCDHELDYAPGHAPRLMGQHS